MAGPGRIDTAVAVSRFGFSPQPADTAAAAAGVATSVYLARADVFADAVAGGAVTDGPILLVPSCGELPTVVAERIVEIGPDRIVALGGSGAVCDSLLDDAAAVGSVGLYDDLDPIIADDVVALDQDQADRIIATSGDGMTVFFNGPVPAEEGEILVAPPTGMAPNGVFGRITTIAGTRAELVPAALTDAVVQGTLVLTDDPAEQGGQRILGGLGQALGTVVDVVAGAGEAIADGARAVGEAVDGLDDAEFVVDRTFGLAERDVAFGHGQVTVTASAAADARVSVFLQIVDGDVVNFTTLGELAGRVEASFGFADGAEWADEVELVDQDLPTIRGFIGPVPVTMTPNVTLTAFAAASAEVSGSYTTAATVGIGRGISYQQHHGWSTVETGDPFTLTRELDVDANATASIGLTLDVAVDFYGGLVAPGVSATASIDGALTPLDCPAVTVDAALSADGVFEILPLLPDMPRFTRTFLTRTVPLGAWPDCPADIPDPDPDLPDGPSVGPDLRDARSLPLRLEAQFESCQHVPTHRLLPSDAECMTMLEADVDGDGTTPDRLDRILIYQQTNDGWADITVQAFTTAHGTTSTYRGAGNTFGANTPGYDLYCMGDLDGTPGTELMLIEGFGANTGGGPVLHHSADGYRPYVMHGEGYDGQDLLFAWGGSVGRGSGFRFDGHGRLVTTSYTAEADGSYTTRELDIQLRADGTAPIGERREQANGTPTATRRCPAAPELRVGGHRLAADLTVGADMATATQRLLRWWPATDDTGWNDRPCDVLTTPGMPAERHLTIGGDLIITMHEPDRPVMAGYALYDQYGTTRTALATSGGIGLGATADRVRAAHPDAQEFDEGWRTTFRITDNGHHVDIAVTDPDDPNGPGVTHVESGNQVVCE